MDIFEALKFAMWHFTEEFDENDNEVIQDWAEDQYHAIQKDVKGLAALVTVLNHRCWYWYENEKYDLSTLYSNLYYKYNDLVWNWLEAEGTEEEKTWYFRTMD